MDTILKKLKYLRQSNNLTKRAFAEKLGITPQYYGAIENGRIKVSTKFARHICDVMDCTMEYLTLDSVPIDMVDYGFDDLTPDEPSFVESLEKLSSLFSKGLLTDDEFKLAKRKLLNG